MSGVRRQGGGPDAQRLTPDTHERYGMQPLPYTEVKWLVILIQFAGCAGVKG